MGYSGGGMARCKNGRCERPFWATTGRVYCERCLVLGDDRRDRARLRYRRRVLLRTSVAEPWRKSAGT